MFATFTNKTVLIKILLSHSLRIGVYWNVENWKNYLTLKIFKELYPENINVFIVP